MSAFKCLLSCTLHRLLDGVEVREPKNPLQYITLVLAENTMNLNIAWMGAMKPWLGLRLCIRDLMKLWLKSIDSYPKKLWLRASAVSRAFHYKINTHCQPECVKSAKLHYQLPGWAWMPWSPCLLTMPPILRGDRIICSDTADIRCDIQCSLQ